MLLVGVNSVSSGTTLTPPTGTQPGDTLVALAAINPVTGPGTHPPPTIGAGYGSYVIGDGASPPTWMLFTRKADGTTADNATAPAGTGNTTGSTVATGGAGGARILVALRGVDPVAIDAWEQINSVLGTGGFNYPVIPARSPTRGGTLIEFGTIGWTSGGSGPSSLAAPAGTTALATNVAVGLAQGDTGLVTIATRDVAPPIAADHFTISNAPQQVDHAWGAALLLAPSTGVGLTMWL